MSQTVVMPKLGLTMQEAELTRWLVNVGDEVRAGQPICEIETDKITMEVEAPAAGVVLRRVEAGVVVPVGAGIAVLGASGESVDGVVLHDDISAPATRREPEREDAAAPANDPGTPRGDRARAADERQAVAPVARRLAAEMGVDLSTVRGTGPGGRVVRRDVEAAAGVGPGAGDDGGS